MPAQNITELFGGEAPPAVFGRQDLTALFDRLAKGVGISLNQAVLLDSPGKGRYGEVVYFSIAPCIVPMEGFVADGIPFRTGSSGKVLSSCDFFPQGLFPGIPDDFEINASARAVPRTKITLPGGNTLFVVETVAQITQDVQKARQALLDRLGEALANAVSIGVRSALYSPE